MNHWTPPSLPLFSVSVILHFLVHIATQTKVWSYWLSLSFYTKTTQTYHYMILFTHQLQRSRQWWMPVKAVCTQNLSTLFSSLMADGTNKCVHLLARSPGTLTSVREEGDRLEWQLLSSLLPSHTSFQMRHWPGISHVFGLNSMIGKHPPSHFLLFCVTLSVVLFLHSPPSHVFDSFMLAAWL